MHFYDRLRSPLAANIFLHAKHFILTAVRFARLIETGASAGGGGRLWAGVGQSGGEVVARGREIGDTGSAAKLRHVFTYGVAQMRRFIIVPHATCVFHFPFRRLRSAAIFTGKASDARQMQN